LTDAEFPIVYPETKGIPLEEMDAVFGEGKHAKYQTGYRYQLVYRRTRREDGQ
jgi:hypothetical protein